METIDAIKQLCQQALLQAQSMDWSKALQTIENRTQKIHQLFSIPIEPENSEKIRTMIEEITFNDEKLQKLANESKSELSGQISLLALSKKASQKYQQIASQK